MKSRIQFFKDSQFKSDDSEAAAVFSILMDSEFQKANQLKNDFLKKRLIIAGVMALVGLALIFVPIYPVAILFLVWSAGAAVYFSRKYKGFDVPKFIDQMGKFYWKISLFPFRNGCVAIDDSGIHDALNLQYPFIDNENKNTLDQLRQEFSQITDNQELFLEDCGNDDQMAPFAYYGIEKRIREIIEKGNSILGRINEKTAGGPLLPASSDIGSNMTSILKDLQPYSPEEDGDIVSIQECNGQEAYESLIQMDTFIGENKENPLEKTLDGWIEEVKHYLGKRETIASKKELSDFREEFLSHFASPGYNHYCPECNRDYSGNPADFLEFTFDENSRMVLKMPGKWQCPVCGHNTPNPIMIPRVYDEVIYPVTRLLIMEENAKIQGDNRKEERIDELATRLLKILSPEFHQRLKHEKEDSLEMFSRIFASADQTLAQSKSTHFAELVRVLEESAAGVLNRRRQLEGILDAFKVDLSIPASIQLLLPFYLVKYGGVEGNSELQVIMPSSLVKLRSEGGPVNYRIEPDKIFAPFKEAVQRKMTALLNDKKYRIEKVKQQKWISRGMQKIKDTDFYSEQRDQFFEFIDKTYFQAQEN